MTPILTEYLQLLLQNSLKEPSWLSDPTEIYGYRKLKEFNIDITEK